MAHDVTEARELPARRLETFPPRVRTIALALVFLGLAGFVAAAIAEPARAWRAYLQNWLFTIGIAHGAVLLTAVVTIAKGLWSRPIRRIALSFVAFLPIGYLLMIPMFFAAEWIFPWVADPGVMQEGKEVWLNVPFLAARNLIALGGLVAVSLMFAYWSLRPDLGRLRNTRWTGTAVLHARITRNWTSVAQEDLRAHGRMSFLAPLLVLTYAVALSFVAWDFAMSLEPHWYSTLFGPYYFMAALLGGICATAILTVAYRAPLGLASVVAPPQFHDLGKLTFAFCVFWAYLLWSQYIVIWYGNLPWEQAYVIHRLSPPFTGLSLLVFLLLFVGPFFLLLGVRPKQTPETLATVAALILFGLWVERYLLVYPSHYPGAGELPMGWVEIVTPLGFIGLLVASVVWFATRFPMLQMWRPASELELLGETQEPMDQVSGR